MQENNKSMTNINNEVLIAIQKLKEETGKFSWLLGEEITHQILKVLETKKEDLRENLVRSDFPIKTNCIITVSLVP